jgi:hypothetical protein
MQNAEPNMAAKICGPMIGSRVVTLGYGMRCALDDPNYIEGRRSVQQGDVV